MSVTLRVTTNENSLFTTYLARGPRCCGLCALGVCMPVMKILVPGAGWVPMDEYRKNYIRPATVPARRSDIFGRCKWCGGFEISGICQACGHQTVCASCRRTRHPGDIWRRAPIGTRAMVSHTCCPECLWHDYPDIALRIAQSKHKNEIN